MRLWLAWSLILEMAMACTVCQSQSRMPPVRLHESVEVKRQTILLSDLLPAESPATLKTAAAAIELGDAPQAGSVRVFPAAKIARKLSRHAALLSGLSVPARVTVRRKEWRIPGQAIETAIAKFWKQQGWKRDALPETGELAWTAAAAVENPVLQVTASQVDPRRQMLQLRLRCVERSTCGSFLVMAPLSRTSPAQASEAAQRVTAARPEPIPKAGTHPSSGPILVRAGDFATLVLESEGIRISLPVTCLQRGGLLETIRARQVGGQHVYQAEVVGHGMLKAVF